MESFLIAVNAVMPFLIYISFGYGVVKSGLADEAFMNKLNKVVFRAFVPLLMFNNMYQLKRDFSLNLTLVATAVLSVLFLQALLLLVVPRLVKENPRRGVIIQAIYRSNFVLFGIPLAANLFGDDGSALASMMVAIVIPVYNVTAVIILEMFRGDGGKTNPLVLVRNVCTNPLILGAAVGLVFFALRIKLPSSVEGPVSQFAGMTTPLALFVLGGTLHFSAIRGNLKYIVPSMTLKLALLPLSAPSKRRSPA